VFSLDGQLRTTANAAADDHERFVLLVTRGGVHVGQVRFALPGENAFDPAERGPNLECIAIGQGLTVQTVRDAAGNAADFDSAGDS
jgi:hypothetical protein